MGKKKKSNNQKKKNKKGNNRNKNPNRSQPATAGTPSAATEEPSINTISNDIERLSINDNVYSNIDYMKKPPIEPGRFAKIVNLEGRTDLNGEPVTIQEILSNGRVLVEHTELLGIKKTFSIKKENLESQWGYALGKEDAVEAEEECPICMDTIMGKQSGTTFSCCGKLICDNCWIKILQEQRRRRTHCRCPFCNSDSPRDVIPNLRARAGRGDTAAMRYLADCYRFGSHGAPKDFELSRMWLLKSAEKGIAASANNLATYYLHGIGGPANEIEGMRWLRAASDMGSLVASVTLASFYIHGLHGVPIDIAKAKMLLQEGIDAGDERAIRISETLSEDRQFT